ncbi:YsnF/AvaK domain-containing protein [Lichenicoccus sp.]|uniref:YsnF/AvaK domain-containing protein n=1 Tax=Lichenicoccus sp. TaxID=2781899 RepID=UPI003D0F950B
MASESIVAVFSDLPQAEAAIADLVASGVPAEAIKHYRRDGAASERPGLDTQHQHHSGFWAWLTGQETDQGTHDAYSRSIQSGHTVVTVISDTTQAGRIHEMLERHNPLDLDDHDAQADAAKALSPPEASMTEHGAGSGRVADKAAQDERTTMSGKGNTEEVLALSEETLQVGKREIDRGTTRIRRYTVERPVEEQIRLRDEFVSVVRRPVADGREIGADAFSDREVVVTESHEEAVVGKTARVVEEVVVQKDTSERVETIRDTLRRDEVEVEGPEHRQIQTDHEPDRTV